MELLIEIGLSGPLGGLAVEAGPRLCFLCGCDLVVCGPVYEKLHRNYSDYPNLQEAGVFLFDCILVCQQPPVNFFHGIAHLLGTEGLAGSGIVFAVLP